LTSSPEIVERCRRLGLQWLKLAQQAEASGRSANMFVKRSTSRDAQPPATA
jgi:hypothetical protein